MMIADLHRDSKTARSTRGISFTAMVSTKTANTSLPLLMDGHTAIGTNNAYTAAVTTMSMLPSTPSEPTSPCQRPSRQPGTEERAG